MAQYLSQNGSMSTGRCRRINHTGGRLRSSCTIRLTGGPEGDADYYWSSTRAGIPCLGSIGRMTGVRGGDWGVVRRANSSVVRHQTDGAPDLPSRAPPRRQPRRVGPRRPAVVERRHLFDTTRPLVYARGTDPDGVLGDGVQLSGGKFTYTEAGKNLRCQ
jgi:hypothetical protein